MSTFLELCQRARREVGIPGTGPSTVAGQVGDLGKLVVDVAEAWNEIQESRPNWRWMRGEWTLQTVAAQGAYTVTEAGIVARHRWWDRMNTKLFLTADGVAGEAPIPWISYSTWERIYNTGSQVDDQPVSWSIRPEDDAIVLGPAPDAVYTVSGWYWKNQQKLTVDADTPECPADYHITIIWLTVMMNKQFTEAAAQFDFAVEWYGRWLARLELNQLVRTEIGMNPIGDHGLDEAETAQIFEID